MTQVKRISAVVFLAAISMLGCQAAFAECGTASYYTEGARTANGEHYNSGGITAAHRSLPFGSIVNVRNQATGRSVQVRINDRGPFVGGRIIDLSGGAKNALGMGGLAPVCIDVVSYGSGGRGRVQTASYRGGRVARGGIQTASYRGVRVARGGGQRYARVQTRARLVYAAYYGPAYRNATQYGRGRYAVAQPRRAAVKVAYRRRAVSQDDDS